MPPYDSTDENPIVIAKGNDEYGQQFEERIYINDIDYLPDVWSGNRSQRYEERYRTYLYVLHERT